MLYRGSGVCLLNPDWLSGTSGFAFHLLFYAIEALTWDWGLWGFISIAWLVGLGMI